MSRDTDAVGSAEQPSDARTVSRRRFLASAGATGAAVAAGSGNVAAASSDKEWTAGRDGLDFASDYVPSPYFAESTLTKAKHRLSWGTSHDALTAYENDSGKQDTLPGYVPTTSSTPKHSTDNVVTVRADKFEAPDLYNFPRGETYDKDGDGSADADVYALDATHWSTTNATNGSISVTDVDRDVRKALRVESSALADGETVTATFTDVSITDDVAKIFHQGVASIPKLGSYNTIEIVARDDDGDEKIMKAVAGGDTSKTAVFAASTGDGYVWQQRNGDLATSGSGDGTFDAIEEVEIRISASGGASDAAIELTALNMEKPSKWVFGSYLKNEGTDSETREKRVRPGPGTFTITGLDTLSSELRASDAVIYDVEVPMRYTLQEDTHNFEFRFVEASDYPGYDWRLQLRGKQHVPTGYDLTHTGLTYTDYVTAPAGRYVEVWTASGVKNTDFADIADSAKTQHASKYDSRGTTVTLNASGQAGTVYAYGADILVTSANKQDATASAGSGGGGGAPPESASGNSGLIATVLAIFGGGGFAMLLRRVLG